MDDRVREQFSARAQVYDANRRLLIADFDEYYSIAAAAITYLGPSPEALDLGAGTGLTTEFLLKRYPDARVTLVDFSEEMLAQARERFAGNSNITYLIGDYRTIPEAGTFDTVISGLSIHHLPDTNKAALFSRIARLLKPGGEFINADLVLGADQYIENLMQERLLGFLSESLDPEAIERFIKTQAIDDPAPVLDQLHWLQQANFMTVDCIYRRWIYAVFYAKRAQS